METDKIEKNDYSDEKAALNQALDFHKNGDYAKAEAIYRRIYSENPKNSDALHLSALILYHFGFFSSAIAWIDRAISLNGKVPQYYYNKGLANLEIGNVEEAKINFSEALAIKPDYEKAKAIIKELGNSK